MKMMQAIARFIHHSLGAKSRREKFWASEEEAEYLEKIGVAVPVEGKTEPLVYATKVVPLSALPAAQAQTPPTLSIAEAEAGRCGPQTQAIDSDATDSTPATIDGGQATPKRRGRPPKSGRKTEAPASDSD